MFLGEIPEVKERQILDLLQTPGHIVNSESFIVEAEGIARIYQDVQLIVFDKIRIDLLNLDKNIVFFKENRLVEHYQDTLVYERNLEIASSTQTLLQVELRGKNKERVLKMKEGLNYISKSLSAEDKYEQMLFSGGFYIERGVYLFR